MIRCVHGHVSHWRWTSLLPPSLKHYRIKYSIPTQTVRSHTVAYVITAHSSVIVYNLIINTEKTLAVRLYFQCFGSGLRLEEEASFIAVEPTVQSHSVQGGLQQQLLSLGGSPQQNKKSASRPHPDLPQHGSYIHNLFSKAKHNCTKGHLQTYHTAISYVLQYKISQYNDRQ